MAIVSDKNENRTQVRIRTDSGDNHEGFVSEADLEKVRKAINGQITDKSITITLHKEAEGGTNEHLQVVTAKLESVKLL